MGSDTNGDRSVSALRSRSPGEDEENPYEDVDVSALPDWWQEAIAEFDEYGLRPYRPPRFADGSLKHEVVKDLETSHGIDITFIAYDVRLGDDWVVQVDEGSIGEIGRHRSTEGYTVFELDSKEFIELVESNL